MASVTIEDIKKVLTQIADTSEYDATLEAMIPRAERIVTRYLGFTFNADYTSATTKVVRGSGVQFLELPPHQYGSITSFVSEGSTTEITGWTEDVDGRLYWAGYPYYSRWPLGTRYTVTANWGYGDWPEDVVEVIVELVCNIFTESKTGHFSDIQGVQGAGGDVAVGYAGALTKRQKMILDMVKNDYMGITV